MQGCLMQTWTVAVIVVFTLEYSLKLATCPRVWEFVRAPLNVIDLLAIIPFYLELLMKLDPNYDDSSDTGASRILRVIRLVRVFRVLKLGGKFGKIQVVAKAVTESADMLAMLFFLQTLALNHDCTIDFAHPLDTRLASE